MAKAVVAGHSRDDGLSSELAEGPSGSDLDIERFAPQPAEERGNVRPGVGQVEVHEIEGTTVAQEEPGKRCAGGDRLEGPPTDVTEPRDVDCSYPAGHFTALARADDLDVVPPSAQLLDQELSLVLGSSAGVRGVVESAVEYS
jgi:hypothetical protein